MTASVIREVSDDALSASLLGRKLQLVDAVRMLERAEIIDHNGHCSVRRDATSFYINTGASVRGKLTLDLPESGDARALSTQSVRRRR